MSGRPGYFRGEPVGPGLRQMRAAAKPGECICCGDPALPLSADPQCVARRVRRGFTRTHQDTCGSPDCRSAWFRFWRRDERAFGREPHHHVIPAVMRDDMKRGIRRARQPEMNRRIAEGLRRRNAA